MFCFCYAADIQESKPAALKPNNQRIEYCYYANVKCDHNSVGPWQMIKYIKESTTPNAIKNKGDVVVISDSDDDDDAKKSECEYFLVIQNVKLLVNFSSTTWLIHSTHIVIETQFFIVKFDLNLIVFH